MATIRILLALLCFIGIGRSWRTDRSIISDNNAPQKLLAIAAKEVGVKEDQENSSARVDQYNAYVGFKSVPWCASFVSWCHAKAGYAQPRTAWSPSLFPRNRLVRDPLAGMVMGIYFPSLKRIAHCGFVAKVRGDWLETIEGNSSNNGSREGTGVFRRLRHKRTIARYANWL